ncbi:MAG: 2-dehydropantoate 2-reductase [Bifidobacteriaceae bacterium]|nr:2-dehydropantoate 2-reductase [Bifidobacteriaceae bacterium]
MKALIVGAGAIGGCLGGWLSQVHETVWLYDLPAVASRLREQGLWLYKEHGEADKERVEVRAVDDLKDVPEVDVVFIAVKNYSLAPVAKVVKEQVAGSPVVVGLQNGVLNQTILPDLFERVLFGVIEFNAWIDQSGAIGYQSKGPFVLGGLDGAAQADATAVADWMGQAVETIPTDRIRDAALCKMVINLTNSFTTLVGFKYREIDDMALFKRVLSNSMCEGVTILKAAGVREFKVSTMPSWTKIWASAKLPDVLTNGIFQKSLDKMVLSSMAQDILQRKTGQSEVDSLLGHFVRLADEYHVAAPYNRAVYRLCQREFAKPDFVPMTEAEVFAAVQQQPA